MTTTASSWSPPVKGAEEHFIIARPGGRGSFAAQLSRMFDLYEAERQRLELSADTGVTVTVFLSDAANQEDALRGHPGFSRLLDENVPVTVIQQPPAGAKIGLLAYHVRRPAGTAARARLPVPGTQSKAAGLSVTTGAYRFLYLKNLLSPCGGNAGEQTDALLGIPGASAQSSRIALDDVIRTWLYIADLDTNYMAVSSARNRIFDRHGITKEAGFPASTGIQGRSAETGDLLLLDVLAIQGLQPGQNRRMEALTHMNATIDYGVTFERGRAVVFGDRRHLYISGTASISHKGEILHLGDVSRQTERAIENVAVLLGNSGARLESLCYLIVYLRDFIDSEAVEAVIAASALRAVPRILVHAPVCRPGWLIELEGVAIDGQGDTQFAAF